MSLNEKKVDVKSQHFPQYQADILVPRGQFEFWTNAFKILITSQRDFHHFLYKK
jgi:hypothetical protein